MIFIIIIVIIIIIIMTTGQFLKQNPVLIFMMCVGFIGFTYSLFSLF